MTIALFGKNFVPENGAYMRQLLLQLSGHHADIVFQIVARFAKICICRNFFYST
mgnify:CR=1 FL=1